MARLITIFWRDIPSRLVARRGRESTRVNLPLRFQRAVNRAAMRAGKGGSREYIDDWRRETAQCDDDIENALAAHTLALESAYSDERLEELVKNSGREQPVKP